MIVYKYLHPDRIDVLAGGLIRFTQAAALNDPFESTPTWEPLFKSLIEHQKQFLAGSGEEFSWLDSMVARVRMNKNARRVIQDIIEDTRNNKGVLSLSLNRSDLLATGQKFDNLPPDSNIKALEVGH